MGYGHMHGRVDLLRVCWRQIGRSEEADVDDEIRSIWKDNGRAELET